MNLLPKNKVPKLMKTNIEFEYAVRNCEPMCMMPVLEDLGYEATRQCAEYAIVFGEMWLKEKEMC